VDAAGPRSRGAATELSVRATIYARHGGPEVLNVTDVPDPQPGALDVVVAVGAAALNRLDVVQRNGWYTLPGFALPHIAGMDVAGTVAVVGSDVDDVTVGDRVVIDPSLAGVPDGSKLAGRGDLFGELGVIGATTDGGYAELCLAPSTHVYTVPASVSLEAAATFPTCHLTASHGLFEVGRLRPGETVLIHAAGSGLSIAAIQLAVHAGATVLATAGTEDKLARATGLGARHVLNNRTGDVVAWVREVTDGRGADVVFGHVGTALFEPSVFALGVGGRLVTCGNTSGDVATIPSLGFLFHQAASILGCGPYRPEEFAPAWDRFCSGGFDAVIDSVTDLHGVADAQVRMEHNDVVGKLLVVP